MTTRILPVVGDADAARSITTLLSQLPDAEPAGPVGDSTSLIDTLARLATESIDELPEVVLVHERIGPVPALELIREVALRFPAVGVILVTADVSPGLFSAAMDSGARGLVGLPSRTRNSPSAFRPPRPGRWVYGAISATAATCSPVPVAPSSR